MRVHHCHCIYSCSIRRGALAICLLPYVVCNARLNLTVHNLWRLCVIDGLVSASWSLAQPRITLTEQLSASAVSAPLHKILQG